MRKLKISCIFSQRAIVSRGDKIQEIFFIPKTNSQKKPFKRPVSVIFSDFSVP